MVLGIRKRGHQRLDWIVERTLESEGVVLVDVVTIDLDTKRVSLIQTACFGAVDSVVSALKIVPLVLLPETDDLVIAEEPFFLRSSSTEPVKSG